MARLRELPRWFGSFLIATVAVSATVNAQPNRESEPTILLGGKGHIGAWLLAGPLSSLHGVDPATILPGRSTAPNGTAWRLVADSSATLDIAHALGLTGSASKAAVAGGWLHLTRSFDGWLLVSADGILRVEVDGRWVFERPHAHRRGHGWAVVPLTLTAGEHCLAIALERRGPWFALQGRLIERSTGRPPAGARWVLPSDATDDRLRDEMLEVRPSVRYQTGALALNLEIEAPGGSPAFREPVTLSFKTNSDAHPIKFSAGTWDCTEIGQTQFAASIVPLDVVSSLGSGGQLEVRVGGITRTLPLDLSQTTVDALEFARATWQSRHDAAPASTDTDDVPGATLEHQLQLVADAVVGNSNADQVAEKAEELRALASQIRDGNFSVTEPGVRSVALRSPFDGRPDELVVHVPAGLAEHPEVRRPLVAVLHGYNGSPQGVMAAFLDTHRTSPHPRVDGFVIAPAAHGNSFYRGPGEASVLRALDWAERPYPVDPRRVSITGVSMGGTGAARIALHRADRFAAAAPLCGYQSYFVRRDTAGRRLRPWEQALMHANSPASWADSGRYLPLYVAQGLKDRPLENSRVLTLRYTDLGYPLVQDWPDVGHAVWKKEYQGASLWDWLSRARSVVDPPRVTLATTSVKYGREYWLEISEISPAGALAHADATVGPDNDVEISVEHVSGLVIHATSHLNRSQPVRISVHGQTLEASPGCSLRLIARQGKWSIDTPLEVGLRKKPGLEGPFSEIFDRPWIMVYGTLDSATSVVNRDVAELLATPAYGVELRTPVVPDSQFDPARYPGFSAVYVGSPTDNRWLASSASRVPIRVDGGEMKVGTATFAGSDVGAAFVYPDPNRLGHLMAVVTAVSPEGLYYSLSLPALVPDFIVFDRRIEGAAGEQVLGDGATVLAAGFFKNDWALPDTIPSLTAAGEAGQP